MPNSIGDVDFTSSMREQAIAIANGGTAVDGEKPMKIQTLKKFLAGG
jgi:hypothetical protein